MSKSTITKLFIQSLVALAGGLVLFLVAGALALANSTLVRSGPDVVGFRSTPFGWAMVVVAGLAILVMVGAAIVQFVAWVGAVANTAQLPDKTWFVILLVTGLLSFGFVAMIVYLVAGPPDPSPPPGAVPPGPPQWQVPPAPAESSATGPATAPAPSTATRPSPGERPPTAAG